MSSLDWAIQQIRGVRQYSLRLINSVDQSNWFRIPTAGVSHIGWQVGHLATAQYRLLIERIRGCRPDDAEFFPPEYLSFFGKGSTPDVDRGQWPKPDAILHVMQQVHERSMAELAGLNESTLTEPLVTPHELFKRKIDAIQWCPAHEMLHAGQIGLLRRQLGHAPLR